MGPAVLGGAQAEIVFLAIAAAERLGVEAADLVQRGTADIHAEADRRRHLDAAAGIHRAAGGIDRVEVLAERQRARPRRSDSRRSSRCWRTARPRRCAAPHRRVPRAGAASRGGTSVSLFSSATSWVPAASMPRLAEATKPRLRRLRSSGDAAGRRQSVEPGGQGGFRRAVVDHDHPPGRAIRIGQHALQAAPGFLQAAIGRDDRRPRDTGRGRSVGLRC